MADSGTTAERFAALLIDRVMQPLALCAPSGSIVHANVALERAIEGETRDRLLDAITRVARAAWRRRTPIRVPADANASAETVVGLRVIGVRLDWGIEGEPPGTLVSLVPATASRRVSEEIRLSYHLTARELDVLRLLRQRRSNAEIADALGISEHTARHHTESVLVKLGLHSRKEVEQCYRALESRRNSLRSITYPADSSQDQREPP